MNADLVPVLREVTPELAAQIDDGLALIWFLGDPDRCPPGIEVMNWSAGLPEAQLMLSNVIAAIGARADYLGEIGAAAWTPSRRAPRLILWITDQVAHTYAVEIGLIAKTGHAAGVDVLCTTELKHGRFHN